MTKNENQEVVVMITCPVEIAKNLAETLVEERLAACVNIVESVQSVYRWEGKVQADVESLLIVKTVASRFADLESRTLAVHPYACPEIVSLPITTGSEKYLLWLREETKQK